MFGKFVGFFRFTVKSLQIKVEYRRPVYVIGGGGGEKTAAAMAAIKSLLKTEQAAKAAKNVENIAVVANVVVEKRWFLSHLQQLEC